MPARVGLNAAEITTLVNRIEQLPVAMALGLQRLVEASCKSLLSDAMDVPPEWM